MFEQIRKDLRYCYRKKIKPFFQEHKWSIIIFFAIVAIVLGFAGFSDIHPDTPISDRLYLTLQLFGIRSGYTQGVVTPLSLDIARFLIPFLTFLSLLIVLMGYFYHHFQIKLLKIFHKNHIVICGLGYIGPVLVRHFCENDEVVVAIEKDATLSVIERCKDDGAIIIIGDATDEHVLRKAHITKARALYAVTGDDELNAKIVGQVKEQTDEAGSSIEYNVHIVDPKFSNFLRIAQRPGQNKVVFNFFNIYQNASYCLVDCIPSFLWDSRDQSYFRIIIVGIGRMGENLLLNLVKRWKHQYQSDPCKWITITIIDRQANEKKKSLLMRYPHISKYCNIEAEEMNVNSSAFYEAEFLETIFGNRMPYAIFICMSDESLNFSAAMFLAQKVRNSNIPIIVRTVRSKGFARFFNELSKTNNSYYQNIHAFPLVSCDCCMDLLDNGTNEIFARALYNDNLVYQFNQGKPFDSEPTMHPWNTLNPDILSQFRDKAKIATRLLNENGYAIISRDLWDESSIDIPKEICENIAIAEHKRWLEFMKDHDWQKGEIRDNSKKTDPYLCEWKDLPQEKIERDIKYIQDYPSILAMFDLKIVLIDESISVTPQTKDQRWRC